MALPVSGCDEGNVYHIFPIFSEHRDELQKHLAACGVETIIHYPIAPHRQQALVEFAALSLPVSESIHATELSLPISPVMSDEEVEGVIAAVNSFALCE